MATIANSSLTKLWSTTVKRGGSDNYVTSCEIKDHGHIIQFAAKRAAEFSEEFVQATTSEKEKEILESPMVGMIIKYIEHAKELRNQYPERYASFLKVVTIYYVSLIKWQNMVRNKKARQVQVVYQKYTEELSTMLFNAAIKCIDNNFFSQMYNMKRPIKPMPWRRT